MAVEDLYFLVVQDYFVRLLSTRHCYAKTLCAQLPLNNTILDMQDKLKERSVDRLKLPQTSHTLLLDALLIV